MAHETVQKLKQPSWQYFPYNWNQPKWTADKKTALYVNHILPTAEFNLNENNLQTPYTNNIQSKPLPLLGEILNASA